MSYCLKDWADIYAHIATVVATLGAGYWFLLSGSFRKRIEFDARCAVIFDEPNVKEKYIELTFGLQNKGQVESRCYTLAYEVQNINIEGQSEHHVLRKPRNVVPIAANYYYVRAGVTLNVTEHFWLPPSVSAIRVKAFILFDQERRNISADIDLFEQMCQCSDWISLDRAFSISAQTVPA